jgi:hypothetical protein
MISSAPFLAKQLKNRKIISAISREKILKQPPQILFYRDVDNQSIQSLRI